MALRNDPRSTDETCSVQIRFLCAYQIKNETSIVQKRLNMPGELTKDISAKVCHLKNKYSIKFAFTGHAYHCMVC